MYARAFGAGMICCCLSVPAFAAKSAEQLALENIEKLQTFNLEVFSRQQWDRVKDAYATNVVVHWPDGRETKGIQAYIDDLKAMFAVAPDTRIRQHVMQIASAEWSSVISIMEGTVTRPLRTSDGRTVQPTGKRFNMLFSKVNHWKGGLIDEEYFFWDNLLFTQQLGVNK